MSHDLKLVFVNEAFIIADKPAGWLAIPARTGELDPRPCLQVALTAEMKRPVLVVHRLDAEVSGLIVYALTREAHRAANQWFEHRNVHKTYEALTEGACPDATEGATTVLEDVIMRGKKRAYTSSFGKKAVTRAVWEGERISDGARWQSWTLRPETGRPHQLRFQLSSRGYPIAGDSLYGATAPFSGVGIALRAVSLDFAGCPLASEFGLPARILAHSWDVVK